MTFLPVEKQRPIYPQTKSNREGPNSGEDEARTFRGIKNVILSMVGTKYISLPLIRVPSKRRTCNDF